eukprot:5273620-Pyramimonas_sp.AAC.1
MLAVATLGLHSRCADAFGPGSGTQSVTPTLALGGEAFWLGSQRKSGVGFAARHASSSCVATAQ